MVVAVFFILLSVGPVVSWLADLGIVPSLGGLTIFVPWLLYAALATLIAVRSKAEAAVTATAMLLPSIYVAANYVAEGGSVWPPLAVMLSLAPALGVFLGMWGGSAVMRPGGATRTIAGFMAAAALSFVGAAVLAVPAWMVILLL